jgi:hypothetical protein
MKPHPPGNNKVRNKVRNYTSFRKMFSAEADAKHRNSKRPRSKMAETGGDEKPPLQPTALKPYKDGGSAQQHAQASDAAEIIQALQRGRLARTKMATVWHDAMITQRRRETVRQPVLGSAHGDEDEFTIESIVSHKIECIVTDESSGQETGVQFLVHWANTDTEEDEWFWQDDLEAEYAPLVLEYFQWVARYESRTEYVPPAAKAFNAGRRGTMLQQVLLQEMQEKQAADFAQNKAERQQHQQQAIHAVAAGVAVDLESRGGLRPGSSHQINRSTSERRRSSGMDDSGIGRIASGTYPGASPRNLAGENERVGNSNNSNHSSTYALGDNVGLHSSPSRQVGEASYSHSAIELQLAEQLLRNERLEARVQGHNQKDKKQEAVIDNLRRQLASVEARLQQKDLSVERTMGMFAKNLEAKDKDMLDVRAERDRAVADRDGLTAGMAGGKEERYKMQLDMDGLRKELGQEQQQAQRLGRELEEEKAKASQGEGAAQETRQKLEVEKELRSVLEAQMRDGRKELTAVGAQLGAVRAESTALVNSLKERLAGVRQEARKESALGHEEEALELRVRFAAEKEGLDREMAALRQALALSKEGNEGAEGELDNLRSEVLELTREAEGLKVQLLLVPKLKKQLVASEEKTEKLEVKVEAGEKTRRQMHNKLQELRGNVRVYARVRPFLPSDGLSLADQTPAVTALGDDRSLLLKSVAYEPGEGQQKQEVRSDEQFSFDRSFAGSTSQGEVS